MTNRIAISLLLLLSGCTREAPTSPGQVTLSAEQIVAGRQAAFRLSSADFFLIRTAAEKRIEVKTFTGPARNLSQWAKALPGMFPPGTGPGVAGTRARPEIWTNRADFERKAADYAAAAERMAAAAEAGDFAEGAKQWEETRLTCNACHAAYRRELPSTQ